MLEIIYEDSDVVAINKPSGLAVHRGLANDLRFAVHELRRQIGLKVYPAHRLDRATSGVLLFALSAQVAGALGRSFAAQEVKKSYWTLVRGIPSEQGTIDHPVPNGRNQQRIDAVTHFRRCYTFERYAFLHVAPETGRFHQIRRHLKHISHPIIGDVRYGQGTHNRLFRQRFGLHRLALHASTLKFVHPGRQAPLTLRAPIPSDLREPLLKMGVPERLFSPEAPTPLLAISEDTSEADPQGSQPPA